MSFTLRSRYVEDFAPLVASLRDDYHLTPHFAVARSGAKPVKRDTLRGRCNRLYPVSNQKIAARRTCSASIK